jgi:hypothetical protein
MSAILQFNSSATSAIQGRSGAKLRTEFRDGVLHVRPTDRKAGPHVLTEMQAKGKGVTIELTDKQVEKLQGGDTMAADTSFYAVAGKYGWFSLVAGDAPEGNDTKVSLTIKSA